MSVNHLHIPASLFLLLSRGSITAAAVDIREHGWQVAWTTMAREKGRIVDCKRQNDVLYVGSLALAIHCKLLLH